ncbi:MAG: hypothetical protein WAT39_21915 [Planctomycetota bacterium]
MSIPHRDELLLQRFLDDRLDPAERAAFAARLAAEPVLQGAAATARTLRSGFAAARDTGVRAPSAGFTAGVLAAARQLPSRLELERQDVAQTAIRWCQRLLLAAAVVAGLGGLWHSGLVFETAPATLQANSGEVQREIERLDELLGTGQVPPPATRPRK